MKIVWRMPINTIFQLFNQKANLFGRSKHLAYFARGRVLEDPAVEAPDDVFTLSKTIEQASDTPEYVTIEFKHGTPVAVNDQALSPVDLLTKLNELGAKHGIGQIDMVENRLVGIKSRGVYETLEVRFYMMRIEY